MPITRTGRTGPPTRYRDAGVNIGDRVGTFIWNRSRHLEALEYIRAKPLL